uniref:Uncharacterized protein n=1 Tax=Rhizophora mucronata TaxID=61149 RepID=A0A2P2P4D8_RHIMU
MCLSVYELADTDSLLWHLSPSPFLSLFLY